MGNETLEAIAALIWLGNMSSHSIRYFQDLEVYRLSFDLQQSIFRHSRAWPREETYALTDQVRRSSRSIGANLAEAWAKRRYAAHFLSKLTDSDAELQETVHWIFTSRDCGYLTPADSQELLADCGFLGRKLGSVITKYESFCL